MLNLPREIETINLLPSINLIYLRSSVVKLTLDVMEIGRCKVLKMENVSRILLGATDIEIDADDINDELVLAAVRTQNVDVINQLLQLKDSLSKAQLLEIIKVDRPDVWSNPFDDRTKYVMYDLPNYTLHHFEVSKELKDLAMYWSAFCVLRAIENDEESLSFDSHFESEEEESWD